MNRAQEILYKVDQVDESSAKLVARIRGGKLQRKLVCPKWFKKTGMACLKLNDTERVKLSKLRKKVFKKKIRVKLQRLLKKRAISMKRREAILGKMDVEVQGNMPADKKKEK